MFSDSNRFGALSPEVASNLAKSIKKQSEIARSGNKTDVALKVVR